MKFKYEKLCFIKHEKLCFNATIVNVTDRH